MAPAHGSGMPLDEREMALYMREQGYSVKEIARRFGRSEGTISQHTIERLRIGPHARIRRVHGLSEPIARDLVEIEAQIKRPDGTWARMFGLSAYPAPDQEGGR